MKVLKRIGLALVCLPVILIMLIIIYEITGMCVNHISTDRQTEKLRKTLSTAVSDIDVINTYSWTGNTGNGNHVECVSEITFASDMNEEELISSFSDKIDEDIRESYQGANGCYFIEFDNNGISSVEFSMDEDGKYLCRMVKSAPFSDNIEGH